MREGYLHLQMHIWKKEINWIVGGNTRKRNSEKLKKRKRCEIRSALMVTRPKRKWCQVELDKETEKVSSRENGVK